MKTIFGKNMLCLEMSFVQRCAWFREVREMSILSYSVSGNILEKECTNSCILLLLGIGFLNAVVYLYFKFEFKSICWRILLANMMS